MVPSIESSTGGGSDPVSFTTAAADRTWSDEGMTLDEFFVQLSDLYPDENAEFLRAKVILQAQRVFTF